jgi:hypothetical protein
MLLWLLRKVLVRLAARQARRLAAEFEAATFLPRAVQEALRQRILATQRNTRFGEDHHFNQIHTLDDFRRHLPIRRYEDIEPYVARVRRGELDALVSDPVVHMFAMTSGTTAKRKYIPVTPQYLADYRRGWTIWGIRAVERHSFAIFRGILQMVSDWDEFRTEADIPCGSVSGLTAHMQKRVIRRLYVMPAAAGQVAETRAKYYTALRLALVKPVSMITSANPSTLVSLGRLLDQEKESLIRDVHDGTLSTRFKVPPEVRESIARRIRKKRRKRARQLEDVVRRTGTLFPKDAWDLKLLGNWTGGSVGTYLRHFPRYFGDTPVRDLGLLASEGRMSIPFEDGTPSGVLDITSHFFEFVPQDEIDDPKPTTLCAHELEEGGKYFIVPTTAFGLYRYNIYDLIRVTGFYNRTPVIEFLNKGAHFANLTGEKLSEFHVALAAKEAAQKLDLTLSAYTLAPCWDEETPYYGLFVERGDLGNLERARALAVSLDQHLRKHNTEYDGKRASGRLGPVRSLLLPAGAWQEWDRQRLQKSGGTPEQYKHPCLIADLKFRDELPLVQELAPEPVAVGEPV